MSHGKVKRDIAGWCLAACLMAAIVPSSQAQEPDTVAAPPGPAQTARPADPQPLNPSPRGAFLRALAIPGWGHAAAGSYTRGGFYFAAETATAWMLFKTLDRLDSARDARAVRESEARVRLLAAGLTRPDSLALRVAEDEEVVRAQGLVEAREQQREDWIALAVFLVLLSGVDAFVSAHLADFPVPLDLEGSSSGGLELRVTVPVGGRP